LTHLAVVGKRVASTKNQLKARDIFNLCSIASCIPVVHKAQNSVARMT